MADPSNLLPAVHAYLKRAGFAKAAEGLSSDLAEHLARELRRGRRTKATASSDDWEHEDDEEEEMETGGQPRRSPLRGFSKPRIGSKRRRSEAEEDDLDDDDDDYEDDEEEEEEEYAGVDDKDPVGDFLKHALGSYLEAKTRRRTTSSSRTAGRRKGRGHTHARRRERVKSYPDYKDLRQGVIDTCVHMQSTGLVLHTSGNVSVRVPGEDLMLVTPTGMDYKALKTKDIVLMDFKGNVIPKQRAPSSEWRFHGDIYEARSDVKAIVHTHSTYCTTLACLRRDVPAFHYMVGAAGGNTIRCAKYGTYGTQELSDAAVEALEGRKACLLANHGMISVGKDLKSALKLAEIVENMCEIYWKTLATTGPVILDDQEMEVILEKFKTYGKQPKKTCC